MSENYYYPRLVRRVQASLIDSLVIALSFIGALFLAGAFTTPFAKVALIVAAVVVIEPVLVSFTGGTIGHHMLGLRVVKSSGSGRLNIVAACWRFIVKTLGGWFSLIVVLTSKKHQALHDLLAGSLVVYKNGATMVPAREKLVERQSLHDLYVMPSVARRTFVVLGYLLLIFLVLSIASGVLDLFGCPSRRNCGPVVEVTQGTLSLAWLVASCAAIVFGARGQLFGCRRKPRESGSSR